MGGIEITSKLHGSAKIREPSLHITCSPRAVLLKTTAIVLQNSLTVIVSIIDSSVFGKDRVSITICKIYVHKKCTFSFYKGEIEGEKRGYNCTLINEYR